jgi:hypothetical protein
MGNWVLARKTIHASEVDVFTLGLYIVSEAATKDPETVKPLQVNPPRQYHVHHEGQPQGPFDLHFIEAMVMAGVYPSDVGVQVVGESNVAPFNQMEGVDRLSTTPIQSREAVPAHVKPRVGHPLPVKTHSQPPALPVKQLSTEAKFAIGMVIAVTLFVVWKFAEVSSSKSSSSHSSAAASRSPGLSTPAYSSPQRSTPTTPVVLARPPRPAFSLPSLALPRSGEVQRYTNQSGVAPLQIQSSVGDHYFVKLEDANSGRPVLALFVRGGQTEEIEVPLGTYRVKYASGEKWYGVPHLFGPDTQYSKADQTFTFSSTGYQYTGYTITLYKVRDGNLSTSKLQPDDF